MRQGMSGKPSSGLTSSSLPMDLQDLSSSQTWHCEIEANPNLADWQNSLPSINDNRQKEECNTGEGWCKQAESSEKAVGTGLISSQGASVLQAKTTELAAVHDGCYRKCGAHISVHRPGATVVALKLWEFWQRKHKPQISRSRLLERIHWLFLQVIFAAAAQMHWKPSRTKIAMNKNSDIFWSHNFQMSRVWFGRRRGTSTSLTFLSSSPQSFLPFPSYLFEKVAFLPFQCHSCRFSLLHVSRGSRNYRNSGILAVPWYPSHSCRVHIFLPLPWGKQ